MSIKRSRDTSRRRVSDGPDLPSGSSEPGRVYKWEDDVAAHAAEPFVAYAPACKYAKDTRLAHKVFGQGIVTRVEGSKIEVLFREGAKKLAHNPAGAAPAPVPAAEPAPAPAAEPAPPPAESATPPAAPPGDA